MSSNVPLVLQSRRGQGGRKLEISISPQQIHANSKGGLINEGSVMLSEYGMFKATLLPRKECASKADSRGRQKIELPKIHLVFGYTTFRQKWGGFVCLNIDLVLCVCPPHYPCSSRCYVRGQQSQ